MNSWYEFITWIHYMKSLLEIITWIITWNHYIHLLHKINTLIHVMKSLHEIILHEFITWIHYIKSLHKIITSIHYMKSFFQKHFLGWWRTSVHIYLPVLFLIVSATSKCSQTLIAAAANEEFSICMAKLAPSAATLPFAINCGVTASFYAWRTSSSSMIVKILLTAWPEKKSQH